MESKEITNNKQPEKKSNGGKIVLIILLVLAVLFILAIFAVIAVVVIIGLLAASTNEVKSTRIPNVYEDTTKDYSSKDYGYSYDDKKDDSSTKDTTTTTQTTTTKVVGDDKYGYIEVPNNWYKFYDVDGASALQYSYASVFIVSLDVLDGTYSAKEYASNYAYNKQNSSDVSDVKAANVTVGKDKTNAYQVYMYYPADKTYLVTYWFETSDGKVRYLAIEGPESAGTYKITDFTDTIPATFSLTK